MIEVGRAAVPIPDKARFPRRQAMIVAAVAAVAMVGTRINPFEAGSTGQPPPSTASTRPPPASKSGLVSLVGSVGELDAQIKTEKNPTIKGELLIKRGNLNSRLGRWRQAADDFRRAVQLDPAGEWTWYYAIPTLVEIGEKAGYRTMCLDMLRTFEPTSDPLLDERIAKLWLLTPECPGDPAIPGRLVDRAVVGSANKKLFYWVISTKGISEYRAGRPAEAVGWLKKAMDATPIKTPQCRALSGLYLSMALHRQNIPDQAKEAYDRAAEIIDRHQSQEGGDLGADWCDWLMCSIARREAEQTMGLSR